MSRLLFSKRPSRKLTQELEEEGHEVRTATTAYEALSAAQLGRRFEIVVYDADDQAIPGVQVAEEANSQLILLANRPEELKQTLRERNPKKVLPPIIGKPFSADEFIKTLQRLS